jgi:hypothetical protein
MKTSLPQVRRICGIDSDGVEFCVNFFFARGTTEHIIIYEVIVIEVIVATSSHKDLTREQNALEFNARWISCKYKIIANVSSTTISLVELATYKDDELRLSLHYIEVRALRCEPSFAERPFGHVI